MSAITLLKSEQNDVEFYTIESTGKSGISQSGLARLCGVEHSTIGRLENTLVRGKAPESLKPFANKSFTLMRDSDKAIVGGKDAGNLKIYNSRFCVAVIKHYADKGNKEAVYSLMKFAETGFNTWVQTVTGWQSQQPQIQQQNPPLPTDRLTQAETEIESGRAMMEQGKSRIWIAIAQIRDEGLWRSGGYKNFEEYCKIRWNWNKSNAHEIATAGRVVAGLRAAGVPEADLPNAVSQIRPLVGLPPIAVFEAWQNVVEITDRTPTRESVKIVVQQLQPDPHPTPDPQHPDPHPEPEPELPADLIELKATINDCHTWLHRSAQAVNRIDGHQARRWLAAVCTRTLRYRNEFGDITP